MTDELAARRHSFKLGMHIERQYANYANLTFKEKCQLVTDVRIAMEIFDGDERIVRLHDMIDFLNGV
jgi:hypothetical protein